MQNTQARLDARWKITQREIIDGMAINMVAGAERRLNANIITEHLAAYIVHAKTSFAQSEIYMKMQNNVVVLCTKTARYTDEQQPQTLEGPEGARHIAEMNQKYGNAINQIFAKMRIKVTEQVNQCVEFAKNEDFKRNVGKVWWLSLAGTTALYVAEVGAAIAGIWYLANGGMEQIMDAGALEFMLLMAAIMAVSAALFFTWMIMACPFAYANGLAQEQLISQDIRAELPQMTVAYNHDGSVKLDNLNAAIQTEGTVLSDMLASLEAHLKAEAAYMYRDVRAV